MAIGVDEDGYREVIGAAEGMKEDAESWKSFLVWLKERGLEGVKHKCLGNVQCRGRGLSGGKIPALYGAFLPGCVLRNPAEAYA